MNLLQRFFSLFKKEKKVKPALKFGWKRDLPDPRDFKFKVSAPVELPTMVDLRDKCPAVSDQGNLGSCGPSAMSSAFQFEQMKQGIPDFMPSRLFVYYNTRVLEGTVNSDSGVSLRDVLKTMTDDGVCPESMWGYGKCFKKKPSDDCYITAKDNQVIEYLRVTHSLYEIKLCLAEGHPAVFGMMLYESFMSDTVTKTGIIPMPNLSTESALGGHAVKAVGYDDSKNCLIVKNSWGKYWGDKGYFYLPYEYVTTPNLTADYWTIKLVEAPVTQENIVAVVAEEDKKL